MQIADLIVRFVTWFGVVLLGLILLGGGIGLWVWPNPKFGQTGNAIATDLLITLGVTFLLLATATFFPNVRLFRWLADETFKKLCIIAFALGAGMLIVIVLSGP